ncbi:hypothetical protein QWY87_12950 [Lutimonas halocynthiae]|uniref:cyclic GMP-AMP synthase DncV-like nucleotidyltransferase n=1 Tax=Lutimonas halocynthiae TaxID=1446477 RepID=UPI0025B408D2|nr:hypothetical protein [Lutimonas halocynthiae]MDN3643618.1 hypothetical protein [Lutimonas halocynthiae]
MAVLHKEFIEFNKNISLTSKRKESLKNSRKELRKKIRKWFKDNKPDELQPKFNGQGSYSMNTVINPLPVTDSQGKQKLMYDLDDGVYFIKKNEQNDHRSINTLHNWIFDSVDNHTGQSSIKKNTCIRVVFADGHHIDLPIYYKNEESILLAHRSKGWLESDPKEFTEWFNGKKTTQLERIVRYLKAWKNFRETNNNSLKLPSGFELTILATENYFEDDNDDRAFRETIRNIESQLTNTFGFKCLRPTTPAGEDLFANYSDTRKSNFLSSISSLLNDLDRADEEPNFRKASNILVKNQFGSRYPLGEDNDSDTKNKELIKALGMATVTPKPYGY